MKARKSDKIIWVSGIILIAFAAALLLFFLRQGDRIQSNEINNALTSNSMISENNTAANSNTSSNSSPTIQTAPTPEVIASGLDTPWAIDFLPDGTLIFTERKGDISVIEGGKVVKIASLDVSEVSESGLLGIAVDPQFEENSFIYVYYTTPDDNRISRFFFDREKKILIDEKVLLLGIPNARNHDGGRIKFSPDGFLYVTTGDAATPSSSQDINSLAGKILRINKDGTAPNDNPFGNLAYSYGHRNPQGLSWNENGQLFAAEHGPSSHDEINLILKGANYGWPNECGSQEEGTAEPLRCYDEFTMAPSGIVFEGNTLYVAGLRGNQVRKLVFDTDFGKIISEEAIVSDIGRVREAVVHEGYLYIATSNRDGRGSPSPDDDRIIKIKIE